jgi:5-(aminomethyl)-3-furanmethanol phosphate kinase
MNTTVIKVGGSIAAYPEKLRALCAKLSDVSKQHRIVMVPGGGEFADVARCMDERYSLSCGVSHRIAILGMDQYGLLLSDLLANSVLVSKLEELKKKLDSNVLPIFLPSNFMLRENPLENSWDVTSDSIALYIAHRLDVGKVVLVTDVDGIYDYDPKRNPGAKLIERLSAKELLAMNKRTSVDTTLPKLLLKMSVDCFIVNGLFPTRIEAILENQETLYTLIKSSLF